MAARGQKREKLGYGSDEQGGYLVDKKEIPVVRVRVEGKKFYLSFIPVRHNSTVKTEILHSKPLQAEFLAAPKWVT